MNLSKKHIHALSRRAKHLDERIQNSEKHLTYDCAELAALQAVLAQVKEKETARETQ